MIFKTNFSLGLDDIDQDSNCKDKVLLKFFEDSACFHSDMVGEGLRNIDSTKRAWALLDWQVKILKRAHYADTITMDTWSRKASRAYAYRDFILSVDGEPYAYASSKWFILDIDKRRPVRITPDIIEAYKSEDTSILGIDEMERLTEKESYEDSYCYTILKSDIDVLGHLHNTHYLDLFYEMLSHEKIMKLTNIRISYKKELSLGEIATIKKHIENGKYYFVITSNDDSVVNAIAEFE